MGKAVHSHVLLFLNHAVELPVMWTLLSSRRKPRKINIIKIYLNVMFRSEYCVTNKTFLDEENM